MQLFHKTERQKYAKFSKCKDQTAFSSMFIGEVDLSVSFCTVIQVNELLIVIFT